nr:MAG TPA: DNA encapsidation protein [Caudoviricetes sp.]
MPESFYYSPQKLLTYNYLWNMVIGERGNGKTYAMKKYFIKDFIKNGHQFVWIRRYETEFDDFKEFFSDIIANNEFPKYELIVNGKKLYCNGKVMGFGIPLSKGITKKSVNYSAVTHICFDEFLIPRGSSYHYLKNEVFRLFDLYETIARTRRVKMFMVANSISQNNPYFREFNVRLTGEFTKVNEQVIVETTNSVNYRQYKKQTDFGRLASLTGYSKYAIDNDFVEDNYNFIEKRTPEAINRFNIQFDKIMLGIWIDTKNGKLFVSNKYNPELPVYCITVDHLKPNYLILKSNSHFMNMLKNAYEYGYIYYENLKIKGYMENVQKYLNIK